MTDKQIIIDGVDVSGCEYLQKTGEEYDYSCYAEEGAICSEVSCSACPNCCYKQLQRKTQECKELKEQLKTLDEEAVTYELTKEQHDNYKLLQNQYNAVVEQNRSLQEELQRKTQECEKLKDEKEVLVGTIANYIFDDFKELAENSIPCMEHNCDCENYCKDECTENGRTCMQYGLKKILKKCEAADEK